MYSKILGKALNYGQSMIPGKASKRQANPQPPKPVSPLRRAILARPKKG